MFKKLKRRFVTLATVSMFLLMLTVLAAMNVLNYISIVHDSDEVLDMLSETKLPDIGGQLPTDAPDLRGEFTIPPGMSPEVPYESRYFIALLDSNGEIVRSDLTNIITVDALSLEEYATEAYVSEHDRAFIGEFRYVKVDDGKIVSIFFLDCGRKLDSFRNFLLISSAVGVGSCVILFILLLFVVGRIVRPMADGYEKQKRFITDAGHEIKTPLTIINTNLDLLADDLGDREELSDMRLQTKRMTELTNDMIMLSRMEEAGNTVTKIDIPVSDIVNEAVASFGALARAQNKVLTAQIEGGVTLRAAPNAVRQLVSILLENAVKYTPENGFVTLRMSVQKKNWVLMVYNSTSSPISQSELPHLFDRFFRTDASRNSETGGHGIGLSIARAIVEAHGGSITASTAGGCDFCMTVILPL